VPKIMFCSDCTVALRRSCMETVIIGHNGLNLQHFVNVDLAFIKMFCSLMWMNVIYLLILYVGLFPSFLSLSCFACRLCLSAYSYFLLCRHNSLK
jgi:hypothetical protein